jgi:hypothetical protein
MELNDAVNPRIQSFEDIIVDQNNTIKQYRINLVDAKRRVEELAEIVQHKDSVIAKQEKANDELCEGAKQLVRFVTHLQDEWQNHAQHKCPIMTPEIIIAMNQIVDELGGNDDGNE